MADFASGELDGSRANSVAYAMAWLAEHSERCINLDRVWNEQRITTALCDALKANRPSDGGAFVDAAQNRLK